METGYDESDNDVRLDGIWQSDMSDTIDPKCLIIIMIIAWTDIHLILCFRGSTRARTKRLRQKNFGNL